MTDGRETLHFRHFSGSASLDPLRNWRWELIFLTERERQIYLRQALGIHYLDYQVLISQITRYSWDTNRLEYRWALTPTQFRGPTFVTARDSRWRRPTAPAQLLVGWLHAKNSNPLYKYYVGLNLPSYAIELFELECRNCWLIHYSVLMNAAFYSW